MQSSLLCSSRTHEWAPHSLIKQFSVWFYMRLRLMTRKRHSRMAWARLTHENSRDFINFDNLLLPLLETDQVKLWNDVNLFLSDSFSITCNPDWDRDWHGERQLAELGLSRIIVRVRTLTLTFVVSIAARQPLRCAAENFNVLEIFFI